MVLGSFTTFRDDAKGIVTAGIIASSIFGFSGARAETVLAAKPTSTASKIVPSGECAAFFRYVADEYRAFPEKISQTFLEGALRFKKAGCSARDKDGEIQIVTMNDQDAASFQTSLKRMGDFDILGVSGVVHCARPFGGVCPR